MSSIWLAGVDGVVISLVWTCPVQQYDCVRSHTEGTTAVVKSNEVTRVV